jgi:hypothetical protein
VNSDLDLHGYDLPYVKGEIRFPAVLDVRDHADRDEVAFWVRSEDGNAVVYLRPAEVEILAEWLDHYRRESL